MNMFIYAFQQTLTIPGKGACAFGETTLGPEGFHFHSHDYTELVIIISGSGLHHTDSGTYPVRGGDVFVIPKGQGHGFSKTKALALYNIGYQSELTSFEGVAEIPSSRAFFDIEPHIPTGSLRATMLHLSLEELEKVLEQLEVMKRELSGKLSGWEYAWYHHCSLLIMQIARIYSGRSSQESSVQKLLQITESISYMEQHIGERISLETIAQVTGFSKQYFIKQFKDSNYFCRIFHREIGITPGAYRKRFLYER